MTHVETSLRSVLVHCEGLPRTAFAADETLIGEGPATGRMFILASGTIAVLRNETVVARIAEPGAVFGEMAAFLGGDHTATVRAETPVEAFVIEDARAYLQGHPEIVFHVASILAGRLQQATTYLADLKRQFADRDDHFGMVDEVLEALVQRQRPRARVGSELAEDPRL
ncbi:Cyclic nucleotide-binding domain-containing protein [Devosia enhydra]|uniref:Cyclic nucleotide-binding domain-containing protein n=1 Tax=Devosia enhydra TaxID=665118 RepID=A0A1K2HYT6_9HYPH|nr:Crp/Fnr family transcriptional regulator [Devosia enhydra]SFZ85237.1 Cyclic nucleotide-binding domain-containing protein [Devosia enhydra]